MMRPKGTGLLVIMALLTLGMVMILPVIGQSGDKDAPTGATPTASRAEVALAHMRTAMVRIGGGSFVRGTTAQEVEQAARLCLEAGAGDCDPARGADSQPAHSLHIDAFWIEAQEVTTAQYAAFLNTLGARAHLDGCDGQPCVLTSLERDDAAIHFDGTQYRVRDVMLADLPVTSVSWYGAAAYCAALDRRLPTEAEWEFAARGTLNSLYPWGDTWDDETANVLSDGPAAVGVHPGDTSAQGVRDLAGNVAEWVADWYAADFYATSAARGDNPTGPAAGESRVIRGGNWVAAPFFARAVQRDHAAPEAMTAAVGFRCAQEG